MPGTVDTLSLLPLVGAVRTLAWFDGHPLLTRLLPLVGAMGTLARQVTPYGWYVLLPLVGATPATCSAKT